MGNWFEFGRIDAIPVAEWRPRLRSACTTPISVPSQTSGSPNARIANRQRSTGRFPATPTAMREPRLDQHRDRAKPIPSTTASATETSARPLERGIGRSAGSIAAIASGVGRGALRRLAGRCHQVVAVLGNKAARESYAHRRPRLLTDDRSNRQLEAIDMGRHSQDRAILRQEAGTSELWQGRRQRPRDRHRDRRAGDSAPQPSTDHADRRVERSVDPARSRREHDVCGPMWQLQGAPVASSVDLLNAWHGPAPQRSGAAERHRTAGAPRGIPRSRSSLIQHCLIQHCADAPD